MKKIFLLLTVVVASLSFSSCSDDDTSSSTNSTITFKVDGVQKTFNSVNATLRVDGNTRYYQVTASNGPADAISFEADQGLTGPNVIYAVNFLINGDAITLDPAFTAYATENTSNHLEGSFSGPVYSTANGTSYTITEGVFEIHL